MRDNSTPHLAAEYDNKILSTIPYYSCFHQETLDLVRVLHPMPASWLDTGCGTGNLVNAARCHFPGTEFFLADPSGEMLTIARNKLSEVLNEGEQQKKHRINLAEPCGSQDLSFPDQSFDVITAIQAHHYLSSSERIKATANCFRMLKQRGVYITFENIKALTSLGSQAGLIRWRDYQVREGKGLEEAEKHVDRFEKEFFPINMREHLQVLEAAGFSVVEVLWSSCMQAGFYAIK